MEKVTKLHYHLKGASAETHQSTSKMQQLKEEGKSVSPPETTDSRMKVSPPETTDSMGTMAGP